MNGTDTYEANLSSQLLHQQPELLSKQKQEQIQQAGRSYRTRVWEEDCGYRKNIIMRNCCPGWLDVRFLSEDGCEIAYYDDTGFFPLTEYCDLVLRQGKSLLRAVVSVLRRLAEQELVCEDFLLSRDLTSYRAADIFIRSADHSAAMIYLPVTERTSFSARISALLAELEREFPENGIELISAKLSARLQEGAVGTKELLQLFGSWEREL